MANDDALALYGAVKRLVDAMTQREKALNGQMAELDAKTAVLSERTAALAATIAELRQLPVTLGRHTSHYIAEGVSARPSRTTSLGHRQRRQRPDGGAPSRGP